MAGPQPKEYTINCLIMGDKGPDGVPFAVRVESNMATTKLKDKIKNETSNTLAHVDTYMLTVWKLNDPIPASGMEDELLKRGENYTMFCEEMNAVMKIGDYFKESPPSKHLHVIFKVPCTSNIADRKRRLMGEVPPELIFQADQRGEFSLVLNNIEQNRSPPSFVKEFATSLAQPRDVTTKKITVKFSSNEQGRSEPVFTSRGQSDDSGEAVTELETIEVVHYQNIFNCFPRQERPLLDAYRYGKEDFFYACFLLPMEQYLWTQSHTQSCKSIKFERDKPWGCTFIGQIGRNELFSYSPWSYWRLTMEGIPCLHIQVSSDPYYETDDVRMLIQAACLVRTINAFRRARDTADDSTFVDVCIYIDNGLIASWYIVYQPNAGDPKIEYFQLKFDLKKPAERLRFLMQLYNFPSAAQHWDLKSIKDSWAESFDRAKMFEFPAFIPTERRQNAETTQSRESGSTADSTGGNPSKHPYDDPSVEERLSQHGYRLIKHVNLPGWKLLNPLKSTLCKAERSDGGRVVLKLVERDSKEAVIHKMLHAIRSPFNHTIPLLEEFIFEFGTIIVVPSGSILPLVPKLTLNHDLARQLLEGVAFMHQQLVAHLDLKPDNMVVTDMQTSPRLLLIDFGTSVQVKSREDLITGYRGTAGWVAPEVGWHETPDQSFSPINADLWACGKMLEWVFSRSEDSDSPESTNFTRMAIELMDENPQNRPVLTLPLRLQGVKRKRETETLGVEGKD